MADLPRSPSAAKERAKIDASLLWRWRRIKGGWRCALRIHRWVGHEDCGDGINVAPHPGYRHPRSAHCWRVCSWCGAHAVALRVGDDRMRSFIWGRSRGR